MSRIVAFFDMDHTIIWENSGHSSVKLARQHGFVSARHLVKGLFKVILYRLAILDIDTWYEQNITMLAGLTPADMERFGDQWFDQFVRAKVYKQAYDLVRYHQEQGHQVVIISNAPAFCVAPVARALQVRDCISTRLEIKDGRFTGKLVKPLCYGKGKRDYAITWAAAQDIDLQQAYFYTDSRFDLALLHSVGHPIATNPDLRLRLAAKRNGWPIMDFAKVAAF
jgi:putative phosphoserine phosphatase / 1-acylglycerol-3-phosphate O-acyltransferase